MSEQQGEVRTLTVGGVSGTHPPAAAYPIVASPSSAQEFNTVRAALIPIACWRVEDLRFDFDSSFVRPDAREEFQHLAGLIEEHKKGDVKPPLSIFGHADPSGSDDYNKQISGRRAMAVYGILTRDADLWEELYSQPAGGDDWSKNALQAMVASTATDQTADRQLADCRNSKGKRKELYLAYMDLLCSKDGKPFRLDKTDFLAQGQDPQGKGDYQGCGEFNPIMIFSQQEQDEFSKPENKQARNAENAPNRRVLVLLYRPGVKVTPDRWPCPRAKEGVTACKKRFWSDGEKRRSTHLPAERRLFENTHDTFACRFYHRNNDLSPCERLIKGDDGSAGPIGDAEEGAWYEDFDWIDFMADKGKYDSEARNFGPKAVSQGMEINRGNGPAFPDQEEAVRQRVIAGEFALRGKYTVESGTFQFESGDLQSILKRYVEEYWLDRNGQPIKPYNSMSGGPDFALPQPNGAAVQQIGGDTPGIEIDEFPAWVKLFQNRLIALLPPGQAAASLTYDTHARASQRLIEAFLNAYAESKLGYKIHPSLIEFFAHVGQSETNGMSVALNGATGSDNWCMPASTLALARGLYVHGYRFKKAGSITAGQAPTYNKEMVRQMGLMSVWQNQGNVLNESSSNPVTLEPGDIVSWVSGGSSPLSGHVATVLRIIPPDAAATKNLGTIEYVSGNAKGAKQGDGSVRAERAMREKVPEMFPERYRKQARIYNRCHQLKGELEANYKAQQELVNQGKGDSPEHQKLVLEATDKNVEIANLKNEAMQPPEVSVDRLDARAGIDVPDTPGKVWITTVIKASRLKPYKDKPDQDTPPDCLERCGKLKELYPDAPD